MSEYQYWGVSLTQPAPSGSGFRMDEDYPKTLAELARRFGTEEACAEYLARLRWPDHLPTLPGHRSLAAGKRLAAVPSVPGASVG